MKRIVTLIFTAILILTLTACSDTGTQSTNTDTNAETPIASDTPASETDTTSPEDTQADDELTFGSTFEFDDLKITIGSDVKWVVDDNEFSESYGADIIELPVNITNLKEESHSLNMFYCSFFGSKGTELDGLYLMFDNDISNSGELREGASLDTYFHILYDGDGDYYIEFDDWSTKLEVKLPITK